MPRRRCTAIDDAEVGRVPHFLVSRRIAPRARRAVFGSRGITLGPWISVVALLLSLPACIATRGLAPPEDWVRSFQSTEPAEPQDVKAGKVAGAKDVKKKEQAPQKEESEVIEERRRGVKDDAPPAPEKKPGVHVSWEHGTSPRLDAFEGDLSIVLGGRLHLDAAWFSENAKIEAAFGEPDPGFVVRRAYVELGGVYKKLEFNLWLNFTEDPESRLERNYVADIDFRNVFVGMRDIPVVGGIRVGYFKEPYGLEEITSSNDITFMERSLVQTFVEARNFGVMLHRRLTGERRMQVAAGVFRDMNNDLDASDGYGVTGRITGVPWFENDGRRMLHVGAAATYRVPSDDTLQFFQRPESNQAQVMADTGDFGADRDVRAGLELATVLGPLSLQTEPMLAVARAKNGEGNPVFFSVYVMASYVLTGEHRSYRRQVGAFGTVQPEKPLFSGGAGAWELTARYSYLNLDSAGIEGGVLHDWTLGLNWYPIHQTRLMLNGIAAHPEGYGIQYDVQVRMQIAF
jgi:phosphate-selective porin OprO/OprP